MASNLPAVSGASDGVLAKIERARLFLEEAKTMQEVKEVIALADAARVYGKRVQATIETTNYAAEIRLRAERRLGEMIHEAPKNTGAKGVGKSAVPTRNRTFLLQRDPFAF